MAGYGLLKLVRLVERELNLKIYVANDVFASGGGPNP